MRVLMAITYFRPYVSGLTVYVDRLASALVERGHEVTILTSQFQPDLPRQELHNGAQVIRVPVSARVSKSVIMAQYPAIALSLLKSHDLVHLHLPQPESAILAALARFVARRPIVLTHHCDLNLPRSLTNRAIDEVAFANNLLTGTLADRIVAYTDDYARHSRFLSQFPSKRKVIPPPVTIPLPDSAGVQALRSAHQLDDATVIGFAARFATEKGVEYLIDALPAIQRALGDVRVLFAGPYEQVIGEQAYRARLRPRVDALGRAWTFLGTLSSQELANVYAACDVTVLPSINSTESFGMVQVEAMACGTPVCASDLPGVRVPIRTTGMGRIVPIANAPALAEGIIEIVRNRQSYVRERAEIEQHFSVERTADDYIGLYQSLTLAGQRGEVVKIAV